MTMLSFQVSTDLEEKIALMASESGRSVEDLLSEMTARMVRDFEAYKTFDDMARRGHGDVEQALELLRKPDLDR